MAVQQNGKAKTAQRALHQDVQTAMIGLVETIDSGQRFVNWPALPINLLPVADNAGDGAQTARHPQRARIGKARQPAVEHFGIEFIGLAVDIKIGAREMRPQQRRAQGPRACKQCIDMGIFRPPQGQGIQFRGGEEPPGIDAARMRRTKNQRTGHLRGFGNIETRIKFEVRAFRVRRMGQHM